MVVWQTTRLHPQAFKAIQWPFFIEDGAVTVKLLSAINFTAVYRGKNCF
jgi:hypothetical protein